jgi:2-methylaconitate cis-trans-isomerase PrpF
MSSAIGPFAVAEGLLQVPEQGQVVVRIHNTNTRKIIHAAFEVRDGQPVEEGELEIPGVHGGGAPVRLDFLEPGGATTGHLLPTGSPLDRLEVPGVGSIEVSMVDAANACVFVNAADLGLTGCELPDALEADLQRMRSLAEIRWSASVAMGIAPDRDAARDIRIVPLIAFLSPPQDSGLVGGGSVLAQEADLTVRMLSSGQPHRALPLTGALCTAVAAQVEGSLAHRLARRGGQGPLRLAMPSGVLTVDAQVGQHEGRPFAQRGSFFRTTRRLFEGMVIV